jgi:pimeloyl-ACP methyl ester carboxylesterase
MEGLKANLYSLLSGDALKSYAGIYEKLSKLDVEVFLIYGGKDTEVSSEQVRRLTSKIQGLKITIMEGSGHAPTIEETDRFNRVLMEYLKN